MTTIADRKRFRLLQDMGCICCLMSDIGYQPPQIHHIVDKGYRRLSGGHQATIPLCPWHHVGQPPEGMTRADATSRMGPSLALDKPSFVKRYGTERELLAEINESMVAS